MLAQTDKLGVVSVGWALLLHIDGHRQINQGTGNLCCLRLREVDEQGQNHFLQLDELVNEAFVLEDVGELVCRVFLCFDNLIAHVSVRDRGLNNVLKELDRVACLLVIGVALGLLQIFG